jgi:predicted PurR-regulated permease PerM
MERSAVSKLFLLIVVLFISVLFISMIKYFILVILLAGIFSALIYPVFQKIVRLFNGRKAIASLITVILLVLIILLPLTGLFGIITAQAIKVANAVKLLVSDQLAHYDDIKGLVDDLPFQKYIAPYTDDIIKKLGEVVGTISKFLLSSLSSVTVMTANFILLSFIFLYTMFFFLMDGEKVLKKIQYYMPLEDRDEQRLLEKFTSVTRATLKGTAVIGILQGTLAGLAFAAVGIPQAVFWGTIMTVLSIIPGIGSGLVWFPAGLILAARGHYLEAAGLILFCALVVGSLDNLLRPRLVGKDTQMHELLIFFSTMGGLIMFGIIGFIIGPIIAALFVTIWDIYGEVFKDFLPQVGTIVTAPEAPSKRKGKKSGLRGIDTNHNL